MRPSVVFRRRLIGVVAVVAGLSAMSGIALALVLRSGCKSKACEAVLLGNTSVESHSDSNSPGQAEAFRFVARRSGTARSLSVYLNAGNRAHVAEVALYRNVRGHDHPGSRLTSGILKGPKGGKWNTIALRPVKLSAGKVYWLALLGKGGRIQFPDRAKGRCISVTSAQRNLLSLRKTWTGATRYRTCPVSAYVSSERARSSPGGNAPPASPAPPKPSAPAQSPVPPGLAGAPPAPACTSTLAPGSNVNAALQTAPGGAVICLASGDYGNGSEFDLDHITPASTVTLEAAPGAIANMGWMNINTMSNVVIRGLYLNGGASLTNAATNVVLGYNTVSGNNGAGTGFYFYGNGQQQSGIQVIGNQIDHLAPSDLSPPGAGQCITVNGGGGMEHNFTFNYNICGPGMANHYSQFGGIDGLTEDYNYFVGPAAAEAISQNEHNNVLQIFGGGDNIDFSHNVVRDTDSRGQTVLLQTGHFSNVTVNNNLWDEDRKCLSLSANCASYAFGMCAATNLQFNYNTVVNSDYGIQVTNSVLTDSSGNPTGCTNQGNNYTVTHNIVVGTGDNVGITYNECRSSCTFDYNVTDDSSAHQGGSTHYMTGWKPHWTDQTSYQPVGLPFAAGYTG